VSGQVRDGRADHRAGGDAAGQRTGRDAISDVGKLIGQELAERESGCDLRDLMVQSLPNVEHAGGGWLPDARMGDGGDAGHRSRTGGSGDHGDRSDERSIGVGHVRLSSKDSASFLG